MDPLSREKGLLCFKRYREGGMAESDEEIERLWEGEEEQMAEEDKDWLIQRLREKDIHQ